MTARILACLPLLLLAGCIEAERSRLVSGGPPPAQLARAQRYVSPAPATEETGRRALGVFQRLIVANPQLGFRPLLITFGLPQVEIFHQGGGVDSYHVYVSEGLVNRCKTDDELAAVFSTELGRIVSEREGLSSPDLRKPDRPPMSEAIGRDSGGPFGPPDGTRQMELARYDRQVHQAAGPPPVPEVLAKRYLTRAGFGTAALATVAPILREAEDHCDIQKQMAVLPPAAPVTQPAAILAPAPTVAGTTAAPGVIAQTEGSSFSSGSQVRSGGSPNRR